MRYRTEIAGTASAYEATAGRRVNFRVPLECVMRLSSAPPSFRAVAATIALAGAFLAGCGGSPESRPVETVPVQDSIVPIDDPVVPTDATDLAGEPCEDAASRECVIDLGEYNGVHSCFVGVQDCEKGEWGPCVDAEEDPRVDSAASTD